MKLFVLLGLGVCCCFLGCSAFAPPQSFQPKQTASTRKSSSLSRPLSPPSLGTTTRSHTPFASMSLKAASSDSEPPNPSISLPYAGLWVALIVFAFAFAPGELNSPADSALIAELVANPLTPDTNDLWFTVWNCFTIVPLALAALLLPGSRGPLPSTPFIWGSAFLGYFALGPLMATREVRRVETERIDDSARKLKHDLS